MPANQGGASQLFAKPSLEAAHDLGGLVVRTVAWLGARTRERAELAVPGVTEPGNDVATLIEPLIEGGNVDVDIRVRARQRGYAFRCRNQRHLLDPSRSPRLQDVDRGRRGAAGS